MSFGIDQNEAERFDRWERSQSRPLEYCLSCGEPTGKAWRGDDSLYCDDCDSGPFCEECYDAHIC